MIASLSSGHLHLIVFRGFHGSGRIYNRINTWVLKVGLETRFSLYYNWVACFPKSKLVFFAILADR